MPEVLEKWIANLTDGEAGLLMEWLDNQTATRDIMKQAVISWHPVMAIEN